MEVLKNIVTWTQENIEIELRKLSDIKELSPAKFIHPVRLAVSGAGAGPSLFHMMEVLGKDACIRRLEKAVEILPIDHD